MARRKYDTSKSPQDNVAEDLKERDNEFAETELRSVKNLKRQDKQNSIKRVRSNL